MVDIEKLRGLLAGATSSASLRSHGYFCTADLLDQIPALLDELERKTKALEEIARLGVDMRADFSRSADQSRIAREALKGTPL